eukprot:Hpha_TRINITY_DN17451_c0_g1::TRINITY_DN17451_c0_g1_i1::g.85738::m.85738
MRADECGEVLEELCCDRIPAFFSRLVPRGAREGQSFAITVAATVCMVIYVVFATFLITPRLTAPYNPKVEAWSAERALVHCCVAQVVTVAQLLSMWQHALTDPGYLPTRPPPPAVHPTCGCEGAAGEGEGVRR